MFRAMRTSLVLVLAASAVVLTGSRAGSVVGTACSQAKSRGAAASGRVVLSRAGGSSLFPGSRGEATFTLQGNRRLGFTATDISLQADRLPAAFELAIVLADGAVATGDWCTGIEELVTRRLDPSALAQLAGLPLGSSGASPPQLVLREPDRTTIWMAGPLADLTFTRRGCASLCAPALTASCQSTCEGRQPRRRCVRQCRRGGLQACRSTGRCQQA